MSDHPSMRGPFDYRTRDGEHVATIDLDALPFDNLYVMARRGIRAFLGNEAASKATTYKSKPIPNGDGTFRPPSDEEVATFLRNERAERVKLLMTENVASVREPAEQEDPIERRIRAKAELAVRAHMASLGVKTVRQSKEKGAPVGVFMGEGESRRFFILDDLITLYLENDGDPAIRNGLEAEVHKELKAEERAKAKAAEQAKGSVLGKMFG